MISLNIFKSHLIEATKKLIEEVTDIVNEAIYPQDTGSQKTSKNEDDYEVSKKYLQNQNPPVVHSGEMSLVEGQSFEGSDSLDQSFAFGDETEIEHNSTEKNDQRTLVPRTLAGTIRQGIILSEIIGPPKGRIYWNRYRKR